MPFVFTETVIASLFQFSRHTVFGNIEYPVKVKSVRLSSTLPYADVFPAFSVYHSFQYIRQSFSKTVFRMLFVRIRKSAKPVPFVKVYLSSKPCLADNFVSL